ncbi:family finger-like domain protein [compost metagenome]
MIDSFVTRCPHCSTSFRVTRAQLGAARGAVRCGACMQVFNAGQQLLIDQPGAFVQPPKAPPAPAEPAKPSSPLAAPPQPATPEAKTAAGKDPDTLWIHDDLDLDSLDLDEELAKLEQQEQQLTQEFLSLERAPKSADRLLDADAPARDPHDEAWAEALLRQESGREPSPPLPPAVAVEPPPASGEPTAPDEPSDERREPSLTLDDTPEHDEPADDLHLSAARDEREDDSQGSEPPFSALPPLGASARSGLRDDSLANLTDEPLQLDWQQPKKPWGRWIAWSLVNLAALLALAGQYVSYHFDELARQDRYRPWFEQLCPEIGCTLPSKVDIELIKSSNLVVRSHPEFAGALVVDAILYNRAPFSQPFPLLEMRFADLNGQLLASRRFKPGEYLAGELAGQTEMPPQTPIHISLDILDPGPKAVNYSLSFHSPE